MNTTLLERAILLVKQGKMLEAQQILEKILLADPHNLTAWSWYVKTYPSDEKQLKALALCLQYNPENEQVKQALKKLKAQAGQPPAKKPINIAQWYLRTIVIFLVEVASIFLLFEMKMGTASLILIIPAIILACNQLLIIGAIAPIYMLSKVVQLGHEKKEVTAISPTIENESADETRKWFTIIGIIGTGLISCAIFWLFLNISNENPSISFNKPPDQILQYSLFFWFLVGANVAALVVAVVDRIQIVIRTIRQKVHTA